MLQGAIKIAIVYDWLDKWGGVERVLLKLHAMYPGAVFYTSNYDRKGALWASEMSIRSSFLSSFPSWIRKSRILSLPFYPFAFETFDFRGFDLVISITSAFAKGIITHPNTPHLCYLLTPPRYLWSHTDQYLDPFRKWISKPFISHLCTWDRIASRRPDSIISLSQAVKQRCSDTYHLPSTVVYPPFDSPYWMKLKKTAPLVKNIPNSFYLLVSRLEPYKKADMAIDVFNHLPQKNLLVVGSGSMKATLRKNARNNIFFLDTVTDSELAYLYSQAEAFIMPQEEDFGYTALEAQLFGCPVLGYGKGGVTETVIDGKTGLFFQSQNTLDLRNTLERFEKISYNLKHSTKQFGPEKAAFFSSSIFEKRFTEIVNHLLQKQNTKL